MGCDDMSWFCGGVDGTGCVTVYEGAVIAGPQWKDEDKMASDEAESSVEVRTSLVVCDVEVLVLLV